MMLSFFTKHGNIPNNVNIYVQNNQYIDTPKQLHRTDYKQNLKNELASSIHSNISNFWCGFQILKKSEPRI